MKRTALLTPLVLIAALAACPKDKKEAPADTATPVPVDTTPTDLSSLPSAIPPEDTAAAKEVDLSENQPKKGAPAPAYPAAPAALQAAVQREQSASRFCFQEFGQKADPQLRGAVNMVVTVAAAGITDAKVGTANWTGGAGRAVNSCLNERLSQAWKLAPGAVRPGKYLVTLQFSGG